MVQEKTRADISRQRVPKSGASALSLGVDHRRHQLVCKFDSKQISARHGPLVLAPQFVDRMPTYPITVELPVHQKLSLPGREPAKTRHPLSRALNEVATAQSAVVLEPLKARNSGNLGTDKMGMGMPGTRMPGPDRPYWQRHRR
jgi:hypothetical protein